MTGSEIFHKKISILFGGLVILIRNEKGDQKLADATKDVTEEVVTGSRSRNTCYHVTPCTTCMHGFLSFSGTPSLKEKTTGW